MSRWDEPIDYRIERDMARAEELRTAGISEGASERRELDALRREVAALRREVAEMKKGGKHE